MNNLIFIFVLLFLTSCSTGVVTINSLPEKSHVSVVNKDGSIYKLGDSGSFNEDTVFKNGDTVQLIISADGHTPQSVVLTRGIMPRDYVLSVTLERGDGSAAHIEDDIEEVTKAVAASYQMMKEKDYDGVIRLLSPIASKYQGVSVTNDFLGNAYYLKGDYRKAYKHYSLALKVNPQNFERQEIVRKIKAMIEK